MPCRADQFEDRRADLRPEHHRGPAPCLRLESAGAPRGGAGGRRHMRASRAAESRPSYSLRPRRDVGRHRHRRCRALPQRCRALWQVDSTRVDWMPGIVGAHRSIGCAQWPASRPRGAVRAPAGGAPAGRPRAPGALGRHRPVRCSGPRGRGIRRLPWGRRPGGGAAARLRDRGLPRPCGIPARLAAPSGRSPPAAQPPAPGRRAPARRAGARAVARAPPPWVMRVTAETDTGRHGGSPGRPFPAGRCTMIGALVTPPSVPLTGSRGESAGAVRECRRTSPSGSGRRGAGRTAPARRGRTVPARSGGSSEADLGLGTGPVGRAPRLMSWALRHKEATRSALTLTGPPTGRLVGVESACTDRHQVEVQQGRSCCGLPWPPRCSSGARQRPARARRSGRPHPRRQGVLNRAASPTSFMYSPTTSPGISCGICRTFSR